MLPNTIIDAHVEGNLDGESVRMEIDATATAHLMSVLTDLYEDRIMAFVREYATNARDAHIEAGVDRPIEVTLPSRMSSYYRIKDYGIGLDLDGIRNIYSKYGASTKRASNDFNGMLGLGCKSAMTYAAQFSIISVKDGWKYNVAVSRAADGVGEMQVIDKTPTDEVNGVEIVIPVKTNDVWAVAEKVQQFFQWWEPGTVLVNGKAPKRFEGREISPGLFMVDGLEKDLIVMGNVPYPVPGEEGIYVGTKDVYGYNRKNFAVVYFAQMGEVTFTPSRESLQTNKSTMDTVAKARKLFIDNLKTAIQAEFDALPSHVDALKHKSQLTSRYRDIDFGEFTYKGEVIPEKGWSAPFHMEDPSPMQKARGITIQQKVYEPFHWYNAHGGSPESSRTELSVDTIERYHQSMVFLVNAPKSLTNTHKVKMRRAFDNGDLPHSNVFLTHLSTKPGGVWSDGIPVLDWSVVRDFKLVSNTTSDSTKHIIHDPKKGQEHRAVPDAEKAVYVSPTFFKDRGYYYGPKIGSYIKWANDNGYSFLTLSENRHAKFQREHKDSFHLSNFAKKMVADYEKGLDADTKLLLSLDSDDVARLVALKGLDIADKAVLELVAKVDSDAFRTATHKRNNIAELARHPGVGLSEIKAQAPFADYPLVRCLASNEIRSHKHHVTEYINAVVGSKKKGN
jgi:hypothetical protein